MPWLPLYLNRNDLVQLADFLNQEEELAFIIGAGEKKWRAISLRSDVGDGRHCLWHTDSGPLPLFRKNLPNSHIPDPFAGWTEEFTGADPSVPFFGAGHPGVYWLNARVESKAGMGMSGVEWIGNRYAPIGNPAPPTTKKWWNRLGRFVKKQATRIPRWGPIDGPQPEIWAMPGALEEIRGGKERDANP